MSILLIVSVSCSAVSAALATRAIFKKKKKNAIDSKQLGSAALQSESMEHS